MEPSNRLLKKFRQEEGDDESMEALIVILKRSKISEKHKSDPKEIFSTSGLDKLALKPTKFYKEKIGLSP